MNPKYFLLIAGLGVLQVNLNFCDTIDNLASALNEIQRKLQEKELPDVSKQKELLKTANRGAFVKAVLALKTSKEMKSELGNYTKNPAYGELSQDEWLKINIAILRKERSGNGDNGDDK